MEIIHSNKGATAEENERKIKKKSFRSFTPNNNNKSFTSPYDKVSHINSQNTSSNLLLCCFTFLQFVKRRTTKIPRNTSVKY